MPEALESGVVSIASGGVLEVLTSHGLQTVISLELLTVLVVGPLACLVCYDIAKKNPRANILMTVIATAELYGGASGDAGVLMRWSLE